MSHYFIIRPRTVVKEEAEKPELHSFYTLSVTHQRQATFHL